MAPGTKEMPKLADLLDYDQAVAGHAGCQTDKTGFFFIKPCVKEEIAFYAAASKENSGHEDLLTILPTYYGVLELHKTTKDVEKAIAATGGVVSEDVKQALAAMAVEEHAHKRQKTETTETSLPVVVAPPAAPKTTNTNGDATSSSNASTSTDADVPVKWVPKGSNPIDSDIAAVLDNATYGYKKPNILDVKLGRQLWGDRAPLEKRQRMDEVSKKTTHNKYGFRISGMRVYQGPEPTEHSDSNGYRTYDKDYGRKDINDDNVIEAFRTFLFNESAGVDKPHGRAVAEAFKAELEHVRDVLESEHTRMYSSSLLFVYEGDGPTLKQAIAEGNARAEEEELEGLSPSKSRSPTPIRVVEDEAACEEPEATTTFLSVDAATDPEERARSRREALGNGKAADRSSSRTDSGIAMEFDDELELGKETLHEKHHLTQADFSFGEGVDVDVDVDVDTKSESDSDSDSEFLKEKPVFGLRMIDFAHAKFVDPKEGPDENNLAGVRSLIGIFEELVK